MNIFKRCKKTFDAEELALKELKDAIIEATKAAQETHLRIIRMYGTSLNRISIYEGLNDIV